MASALGNSPGISLRYLKTPTFRRLWRFGSISVVTTLFTLVLLYLFYRVAQIGSAMTANVVATSIASVPSYYLNRTWAWGKTGRSHLMKEVVPFWVIALISLVLSTIAVGVAAHEAHHLTNSHMIQTAFVLLANFATYAVLWVAKFIFFNAVLFKQAGVAEGSEVPLGSYEPELPVVDVASAEVG